MPPDNTQPPIQTPSPYQPLYPQPMPIPRSNRPRIIIIAVVALIVLGLGFLLFTMLMANDKLTNEESGLTDDERISYVNKLTKVIAEEAKAQNKSVLSFAELADVYSEVFNDYTAADGAVFGLSDATENHQQNKFYYLIEGQTFKLCTKLSSQKLYCDSPD